MLPGAKDLHRTTENDTTNEWTAVRYKAKVRFFFVEKWDIFVKATILSCQYDAGLVFQVKGLISF